MALIESSQKDLFLITLLKAAKEIEIEVTTEQANTLLQYLELILKWNKAFNLTAIRQPKDMLVKHLIDSLAIAPYISGKNILDVGTGAGLPGIPMAILFPNKQFSLMDSNGKKTRFLTQSKIELGLSNINIINARVEDIKEDLLYDQIMSRAFTALDNMVGLCAHLLKADGQFLAMKGLELKDELQSILPPFKVEKSVQLNVPGCEEQRHLIIIARSN